MTHNEIMTNPVTIKYIEMCNIIKNYIVTASKYTTDTIPSEFKIQYKIVLKEYRDFLDANKLNLIKAKRPYENDDIRTWAYIDYVKDKKGIKFIRNPNYKYGKVA